MADQTLHPINSSPNTSQTTNNIQVEIPDIPGSMGPSSKDVMIGIGVLLALMIVFFFIRNAFVNYLIGPSLKRSPNNAGMAGWGLFGGLFFGAVIGCVALVSKSYMITALIIPLSLLSLLCFIISFVVALKK